MHPEKSGRGTEDSALLRAIVDQFVDRQMHPISDIRQFEQLALGLIDLLDADSVAHVARPLCLHPETPHSVFARLLDKGGACSELALQFWSLIPRIGLIAVAQRGNPRLACAVARRSDLDREIVEALMQRGDIEIYHALAGNRGARLDGSVRRTLIKAARDDVALARLLLDRDETAAESEALFLAATWRERMKIVLNACRRALAAGQIEQSAPDPALASRLEEVVSQSDRAALVTILAEALGCRKDRAQAIVEDAQGEALALALTALGLDAEAAMRIFLCADETISHDTDRVNALAALVRSTPQRAAAQIVAAMTGARGGREQPRPGLRDDSASLAGRRRPARGVENARRLDQSA